MPCALLLFVHVFRALFKLFPSVLRTKQAQLNVLPQCDKDTNSPFPPLCHSTDDFGLQIEVTLLWTQSRPRTIFRTVFFRRIRPMPRQLVRCLKVRLRSQQPTAFFLGLSQPSEPEKYGIVPYIFRFTAFVRAGHRDTKKNKESLKDGSFSTALKDCR